MAKYILPRQKTFAGKIPIPKVNLVTPQIGTQKWNSKEAGWFGTLFGKGGQTAEKIEGQFSRSKGASGNMETISEVTDKKFLNNFGDSKWNGYKIHSDGNGNYYAMGDNGKFFDVKSGKNGYNLGKETTGFSQDVNTFTTEGPSFGQRAAAGAKIAGTGAVIGTGAYMGYQAFNAGNGTLGNNSTT